MKNIIFLSIFPETRRRFPCKTKLFDGDINTSNSATVTASIQTTILPRTIFDNAWSSLKATELQPMNVTSLDVLHKQGDR